jgi:hypothetical protein
MRVTSASVTAVCAAAIASFVVSGEAHARGASPYLPLNLSPEIERQIERVLILADQPVLTRPIAAATVLDALPKACARDQRLCEQVRSYLRRYMKDFAVTSAGLDVAITDSDAAVPSPNAYGKSYDSAWSAFAAGHWQLNDYVILNVGGNAFDGEGDFTGSYLSVGFDWAQLDLGLRPHWFSPFTDSSLLLSTNAATMPSVTLSNYRPLTGLGLRYELFLAEMGHSDRILFQDRTTSGKPRLAGVHVGIEPVPGLALSANRLLQYGGGERSSSLRTLWNAFFDAAGSDNVGADLAFDDQAGNQQAGFTSAFIFPGRTPFSVYAEYAGEDTFHADNWRLGSNAWAVGIHFPRLWRHFEFTYEFSEWQTNWYVHTIYLDGMTNDGRVLGHWGADQRLAGDVAGGESHMVQLAWEPAWGGELELRYRTTAKQSYTEYDYRRAHAVTVRYSMPLAGMTVGAQLDAGRDAFGDDFARLSGFLRYSQNAPRYYGSALDDTYDTSPTTHRFVEVGGSYLVRNYVLSDGIAPEREFKSAGAHVGIGARRRITTRADIGVRLEVDDVEGDSLIAIRVIDFRYRFKNPLAFGVFAGAARYDGRSPAHGYYGGLGVQWLDIFPRLDLTLEARYADRVVRNKDYPGEYNPPPPPAKPGYPNEYSDFYIGTLSIGYRF